MIDSAGYGNNAVLMSTSMYGSRRQKAACLPGGVGVVRLLLEGLPGAHDDTDELDLLRHR